MSDITLPQSYSRLVALKENLPAGINVDQKFVDEFHGILDRLETESSKELEDFRVPESELRRTMRSKSPLTDQVHYTENSQCDRAFLMMKIDAVLGFFTIQSVRKAVGFKA
jgi:hypothetical protein